MPHCYGNVFEPLDTYLHPANLSLVRGNELLIEYYFTYNVNR